MDDHNSEKGLFQGTESDSASEDSDESFLPIAGDRVIFDLGTFTDLQAEKIGDEIEAIVHFKVAKVGTDSVEAMPQEASLIHGSTGPKFIQKAIKSPGSLRRTAKKRGLLGGEDDKLSNSDLFTMESQAKKEGDTKLLRRIRLARTLAKLRRD